MTKQMETINGWTLADKHNNRRIFASQGFDTSKPETMFFPVFWIRQDAIKYLNSIKPELWEKWGMKKENTIPVPVVVTLQVISPDHV